MTKSLLTTTEAAEILGVTRNRVFALIAAGRLPATRYGHAWLVQRAHLDLPIIADRKPGRPKGWKPAKRT